MKTAMREALTSASIAQEPSEWCGRSKHSPAHSTGLESKTISGGGDNLFLTFPFYRTGYRIDFVVRGDLWRDAVAPRDNTRKRKVPIEVFYCRRISQIHGSPPNTLARPTF